MPDPGRLRSFVFSALEQLQVPVAPAGGERCLISVPPKCQRDLENQTHVPITFDKETFQRADETNLEFVTPGSPLLNWIIDQLRGLGSVFYAELPWDEARSPELVHELVSRYQVEGGKVSMPTPLWKVGLAVQVHYLLRLHGLESRDQLVAIVVDDQGQAASADDAAMISSSTMKDPPVRPALSAEQLEPVLAGAAKIIAGVSCERERELGQALAPKRDAEEKQLRDYFQSMHQEMAGLREVVGSADQQASIQEQIDGIDRQLAQRLDELRARFTVRSETTLAGVLLVAVRRLEGTVVFESNGHQARLPVSVPSYRPTAPSFTCMKTGRGAFRLAVTADGRFVDAGIVARCQHSGRTMPTDELSRCAASGKLYCLEFMAQCPIVLELVYQEEMVECPGCRQQVSRPAMKGDVCRSCSERALVDRSDARVQRTIARYPKLTCWSKWAMSETRDIYSLELSRAFSQARLVLMKHDLTPVRAQKRSRLLGNWKDVQMQEVTGET
jgi:hypothetical protein